MFEGKEEIRVKALELAIERAKGIVEIDGDKVVENAERFEKFILGEEKSK